MYKGVRERRGGELTNGYRPDHTVIQLLIVLFVARRADVDEPPLDVVLQTARCIRR